MEALNCAYISGCRLFMTHETFFIIISYDNFSGNISTCVLNIKYIHFQNIIHYDVQPDKHQLVETNMVPLFRYLLHQED